MVLDSWAFVSCDLTVWQDFRMLFQRCLILDRTSSASTKSLTSRMTQGVLCKPPREHGVQGWFWQALEETSTGLYPPDRKEGHSDSRSLHLPVLGTPPTGTLPCLGFFPELQHLSQGKFVQSLKRDGELCKSSSPDCFCWSMAACVVCPGINVINVVLTSALCVSCTKYCLLESK